jgi:hypothetical protein
VDARFTRAGHAFVHLPLDLKKYQPVIYIIEKNEISIVLPFV